MREHDEFVGPKRQRLQPAVGWLECKDAEIEVALKHFGANLPGVDASHVDLDVLVVLPERGNERQQRMNGRLVRPDQDAASAQVTQLTNRRRRLFGQPHQALGVVEQHITRVGEHAVLR